MGVAHFLLFGMIVLSINSEKSAPEAVSSSGWVGRLPGTGLPVILTAPHGGTDNPGHIPDRSSGCWTGQQCVWRHNCGTTDSEHCKSTTVRDLYTKELALQVREELCRLCGACPVLVYSNIHRRKLDPNREREEAAYGESEMEAAWDTYHGYINDSRQALSERGLLLDLHGHSHKIQRVELGYLIPGAILDSDNIMVMFNQTSINNLASVSGVSFEELLRGNQSFGGLLAANGYPSVPSPQALGPGGAKYFSGGYTTKTYGSRNAGFIDAIQVESASSYRKVKVNRDKYALALALTIKQYLEIYYMKTSVGTIEFEPDDLHSPTKEFTTGHPNPSTTSSVASWSYDQRSLRSLISFTCILLYFCFCLIYKHDIY